MAHARAQVLAAFALVLLYGGSSVVVEATFVIEKGGLKVVLPQEAKEKYPGGRWVGCGEWVVGWAGDTAAPSQPVPAAVLVSVR